MKDTYEGDPPLHTLRELCASKETSSYGKRHLKATCEKYQQKTLVKETYKRVKETYKRVKETYKRVKETYKRVKETYKRDPPCTCVERTLKRDCLLCRKRPVHVKRDLEKRPIQQIYNQTNARDPSNVNPYEKRPRKETYSTDL